MKDKFYKREPTYTKCLCDNAPTIETKHSMKLLPSIPEISENSSSKRDKPKKINFEEPLTTSSREDLVETKKNVSSKIRMCVPRRNDIDVTVCPHYEDKATSLSRSDIKYLIGDAWVIITFCRNFAFVLVPEAKQAVEKTWQLKSRQVFFFFFLGDNIYFLILETRRGRFNTKG